MTVHTSHHELSVFERSRISFAGTRYDFWLDLNSVPRRHRRALRDELRANLAAASSVDGVLQALTKVGSLRALASDVAHDGGLRSRWLAGWVTGFAALALTFTAFFVLSLYYSEGVLDAGATQPVRSSLFPFIGSQVTVNPANGGIAWALEPGPLPLIVGGVSWLVVSKPWRSLRSGSSADR